MVFNYLLLLNKSTQMQNSTMVICRNVRTSHLLLENENIKRTLYQSNQTKLVL